MEPGGKSGARVFPGNISKLDRPEILRLLFFPRPEDPWQAQLPDQCEEVSIPVAPVVALGARFFFSRRNAPNLLFFHGNGEIVGDYTDLGQIYQSMGMHFIPVDYRGGTGDLRGHPRSAPCSKTPMRCSRSSGTTWSAQGRGGR